MWYDESNQYDYQNPDWTVAGHFTQVVWKSSTSLGCGIGKNDYGVYGVCNYSPQGNYLGQFEANVLPK